MTEYEAATLITRYIALAIGVGQLAVVWYGIRIMHIAGERRAREQDQRHHETMEAHDETMTALMEAHDETMTALMEAHDETMTALQALIARNTVNRD